MNRILKYTLPNEPGIHKIKIHKGAKFLSCGNQGAVIVMWAKVTEPLEEIEKEFAILFTGQRFEDLPEGDYKFLGTVPTTFVYHIFEVLK